MKFTRTLTMQWHYTLAYIRSFLCIIYPLTLHSNNNSIYTRIVKIIAQWFHARYVNETLSRKLQ